MVTWRMQKTGKVRILEDEKLFCQTDTAMRAVFRSSEQRELAEKGRVPLMHSILC